MPFKNDTEMILKGYVDEIPHILLFFYNKYRKTKGEQAWRTTHIYSLICSLTAFSILNISSGRSIDL